MSDSLVYLFNNSELLIYQITTLHKFTEGVNWVQIGETVGSDTVPW